MLVKHIAVIKLQLMFNCNFAEDIFCQAKYASRAGLMIQTDEKNCDWLCAYKENIVGQFLCLLGTDYESVESMKLKLMLGPRLIVELHRELFWNVYPNQKAK